MVFVEVNQEFRVRPRIELVPRGLEFTPQLRVIENLPVVDDPEGPVLVVDRLVAALEVEDAQPGGAQTDPLVHVDSEGIGPAVADEREHPSQQGNLAFRRGRQSESDDPAHPRFTHPAAIGRAGRFPFMPPSGTGGFGFQGQLVDFAGGISRQGFADLEVFGDGEFLEHPLAVAEQVLLGEAHPRLRHHEGLDGTPQDLVGNGDHRRLGYALHVAEGVFHLPGAHPLAAGLDEVVLAGDEVKKALLVAAEEVPGVKQALPRVSPGPETPGGFLGAFQ